MHHRRPHLPCYNMVAWKIESPGGTLVSTTPGSITNAGRAPCSKAARAHPTRPGLRSLKWSNNFSSCPCFGHSLRVGGGKSSLDAHSPTSAHAVVQSNFKYCAWHEKCTLLGATYYRVTYEHHLQCAEQQESPSNFTKYAE